MISPHFELETQQYHPATTSRKGFKSLLSSIPTPTSQPILTPAKWQKFWSLRIPLNARNSWFRILHDKIATRDLLHGRQPTIHQPICKLCHSSRETTEYFLFACPLKRCFWSTALNTYMPSSINQNTYSNFRKFLLLNSIYPVNTIRSILNSLSTKFLLVCCKLSGSTTTNMYSITLRSYLPFYFLRYVTL